MIWRVVIITALIVAGVGYLAAGQPAGDPYGVLMSGEVDLTRECGVNPRDVWQYTWWLHCGATVPYRWLLTACIIAAGFALIRIGQER